MCVLAGPWPGCKGCILMGRVCMLMCTSHDLVQPEHVRRREHLLCMPSCADALKMPNRLPGGFWPVQLVAVGPWP